MVMVTHQRDQAFLVRTRQHTWYVDQPECGEELGPTPVELLVAALAACAAHYAVGFLRARGLPHEGLRIECHWTMRQQPPRLGRVVLSVHAPAKLTRDRTGLLTAVEGCTVHNILRQPPDIAVTLDHNRPADEPAAAGS
jgi:uncharacterized OsmC-like protein